MNIVQKPSPNFSSRGKSDISVIVIHWWGLPTSGATFDGVVSYLRKPASQVSAHYVVSDTKVTQLVQDSNAAWHARQANPFSIGIEVDPNTPGDTYETVAELVKLLRKRHGNLPLEKHSKYVSTACPGTVSLAKIEAIIKGDDMSKKAERRDIQALAWGVLGNNGYNAKGEYNAANNAFSEGFTRHMQNIGKDTRDVERSFKASAEHDAYRNKTLAGMAERARLSYAQEGEIEVLTAEVKALQDELAKYSGEDFVTITKDGLWIRFTSWLDNLRSK